ncbi:CRISPR-associated endoribonuclease Cas6 [Solwaraspora sp. WMMB335]|uniref:CRISPR-associated endoribonuclease Cas6 n=1 Tax=Solwaraspora sp. WMMB335 TaxID=3404118 RepID=UPI003B955CE3
MRLQIEVVTSATELPWSSVLAPGRSLAYDLLSRMARGLGQRLHDDGWGPHRMTPFGHSAPIFPNAPRVPGRYAAGGHGSVEFGSPVPDIVEAWAAGVRQRELIDWGGVALRITRVSAIDPPDFSSGIARMRTATPVVMKGSGRNEDGERTTRQAFLFPQDAEFPAYFDQNLRRKMETLGLDAKVALERVTWVGAKRSFSVGKGGKPGMPIEVELRGDQEGLQAIWSWGLGQSNPAGFGWVAAEDRVAAEGKAG